MNEIIKGKDYLPVNLWEEPGEIYNKMPKEYHLAEMSDFQHSYLCGLLRMKKPKKIVELGVSAGGTTAVILNALNIMGGGTTEFCGQST